jgi:putative hydrolase of the HAD superfamily
MAIKVIVFDLGKVLFDFDFGKFSKNVSRHSAKTPPEILNAVEANLNAFYEYETGALSTQVFYDKAKDFFSYNADFETFAADWNDMFTPMDATINFLKGLSAKFHTALLSNTNELHFNYLSTCFPEVFKYFKDLHLSYKMSARKPERKIYEDVINFYKLAPAEIFFTDDLSVNVEAAKSLGIKAYRFTGVQTLSANLSAEGVAY